MRAIEGTATPEESELRSLDLSTLVSQSRNSWEKVKLQIPGDARKAIEPYFNVLTDSGYIEEQMEQFAGAGGTRSGH